MLKPVVYKQINIITFGHVSIIICFYIFPKYCDVDITCSNRKIKFPTKNSMNEKDENSRLYLAQESNVFNYIITNEKYYNI